MITAFGGTQQRSPFLLIIRHGLPFIGRICRVRDDLLFFQLTELIRDERG